MTSKFAVAIIGLRSGFLPRYIFVLPWIARHLGQYSASLSAVQPFLFVDFVEIWTVSIQEQIAY